MDHLEGLGGLFRGTFNILDDQPDLLKWFKRCNLTIIYSTSITYITCLLLIAQIILEIGEDRFRHKVGHCLVFAGIKFCLSKQNSYKSVAWVLEEY